MFAYELHQLRAAELHQEAARRRLLHQVRRPEREGEALDGADPGTPERPRPPESRTENYARAA
ncbi:hypothetical protein ACSMX9_21960 [Streptomyces sp. LE64]|uniref:hypothetical protein n=1 Tax=Streptomyces sp. LE64 TaxID=3448653 RepID=UPI004041D48F